MGLYQYRYRGTALPVAIFQRLLHFWERYRGRLLAVSGVDGGYRLLIYSHSKTLLKRFETQFPVDPLDGTGEGALIYLDDLLGDLLQRLEGHIPLAAASLHQ